MRGELGGEARGLIELVGFSDRFVRIRYNIECGLPRLADLPPFNGEVGRLTGTASCLETDMSSAPAFNGFFVLFHGHLASFSTYRNPSSAVLPTLTSVVLLYGQPAPPSALASHTSLSPSSLHRHQASPGLISQAPHLCLSPAKHTPHFLATAPFPATTTLLPRALTCGSRPNQWSPHASRGYLFFFYFFFLFFVPIYPRLEQSCKNRKYPSRCLPSKNL